MTVREIPEFKVGSFVRVTTGSHHVNKTGRVVLKDPGNHDEPNTLGVRLHTYDGYEDDIDYHTFYPSMLELIPEWERKLISEGVEPVRVATFADHVKYRTEKIASLLIEKNEAYGDSALNPVRVFSKSEPVEQIKVRIDDKISRLQRGTDAGEDTITDLIGYLILLQIAQDA